MINISNKLIRYSFLLHVFASASAQNDVKDTAVLVSDNPIYAAIDRSVNLKFLEYNSPKCDSVTLASYGFTKDSLPIISDSIIKKRFEILDKTSPFHFQYNNEVKKWIDLYLIRKRSFTSRIIGLSYSYYPLIEEILDRYELPSELKHLVIVESALNPTARSRSGAVGLWQFMYRTAKLMHLEMNSYVDERRDVYKSTVAACEYLAYLFNIFNDWELVLAAYNCGPGTITRALRKADNATDYWSIWPYLPRETRGYIPAFYAVNYMMEYYECHNICPQKPKINFFDYDTIAIHKTLSLRTLSTILKIPYGLLRYLNPKYKRDIIPVVNDPVIIYLPQNKKGLFISNEKIIYNFHKDSMQSDTVLFTKKTTKTHIVRSGQYLGFIAKKYHCTIADIMEWNELNNSKIYPGQRLTIYTNDLPSNIATVDKTSPVKKQAVSGKKFSFFYYTIQKGDTLWDIAKVNGITVEDIIKHNDRLKEKKLKPGTKIKIISKG